MARRSKANGSDDEAAPGEAILVTGFPSYTARQLTRHILAEDREATLHLLVEEGQVAQAREFTSGLDGGKQRVRLITGRVDAMDLGLSGHEYEALRAQITTIQHLAGAYSERNDRNTLERINVTGTRNVLEFAQEARKLRRMCHWSTAFVSGKRRGVILEEELDLGQTFHSTYEETKYSAEIAVRNALRHIPVTIFRPSVIVGDTRRGEIGPYDGPCQLIGSLSGGAGFPLSLSGYDHAPCHVVPIDYVVEAAYELSIDQRAAGLTFHLTDPNPLPTRLVLQLIASGSQSRVALPASVARTLLRTPGVERFTRGLRPLIESFSEGCLYNCRTTVAFLRESGIYCPPLDAYIEGLVHVSQTREPPLRLETDEDTFDPFR